MRLAINQLRLLLGANATVDYHPTWQSRQETTIQLPALLCQNYGGQPEVWAVIKGSPGDPEGLWGEVIKYIEEDSARPSPPVQDPLGK